MNNIIWQERATNGKQVRTEGVQWNMTIWGKSFQTVSYSCFRRINAYEPMREHTARTDYCYSWIEEDFIPSASSYSCNKYTSERRKWTRRKISESTANVCNIAFYCLHGSTPTVKIKHSFIQSVMEDFLTGASWRATSWKESNRLSFILLGPERDKRLF